MKKFIMVLIGSLLFLAGYNYTRRQATYAATQNPVSKTTHAKIPVVLRFKALPALVFRSNKSNLNWN